VRVNLTNGTPYNPLKDAEMNRLKSLYLDWKVLMAIVLIGISIWLVAPNALALLLPFLLVIAVPLLLLASIVFVIRGRQKKQPQPRIEGHLPAEQIASLKMQLLTEQGRSQASEKDDSASPDQWMKL